MNSGSLPDEKMKKKRGRPPGSRKSKSGTNSQQSGQQIDLSTLRSTDPSSLLATDAQSQMADSKEASIQTNENEARTAFSSLLQSIIHRDHTELARAARELDVAENTVYRWMNGTSDPRTTHLKNLPDVFPEYRAPLITVINQTFGNILGTPIHIARDVRKEVYIKILEIVSNSQEDETRFWQISEIIFNEALEHLDIERQGMAITYAKLMPIRDDGIHSLREVKMHGHAPWSESVDNKVFLGSTTLVGSAAVLQRIQIWNDLDNDRFLVEIDEHERSACAVPVLRGSHLAGVLVVSSTQPHFFKESAACQAVIEYALLMGVALCDREFHSPALLHLRPMPPLSWQRNEITQNYLSRIIAYAHQHATSRRDAEFWVQHEMEMEFEVEARRALEQQKKTMANPAHPVRHNSLNRVE